MHVNKILNIYYLKDVLGDPVVWELVVLLLWSFKTSSSSCVVRLKRLADRGNYICCVEHVLLFIVSSSKSCSLLLSNNGVSGDVMQKVKRKKEEMKNKE